jgi:hypothetical protein
MAPSALHQMNQRFKTDWINNAESAPGKHYQTFLKIEGLVGRVHAKKAEIEKPNTLNKRGVSEALCAFAGKDIVPEFRRDGHRLEMAKKAAQQRREMLAIPKVDKKDPVTAALRREIRDRLVAMSSGDRTQLVMGTDDPQVLTAVFEAPEFLSGVSSEIQGRVREAQIQKADPTILEAISDEIAAIEAVDVALNLAVAELRKATDFEQFDGFEKWMEASSAGVESEIAAANRIRAVKPADPDNLTFEDRFNRGYAAILDGTNK